MVSASKMFSLSILKPRLWDSMHAINNQVIKKKYAVILNNADESRFNKGSPVTEKELLLSHKSLFFFGKLLSHKSQFHVGRRFWERERERAK